MSEDTAYQCQSCQTFHDSLDELRDCGCPERIKASEPGPARGKSVREANRKHRFTTTRKNYEKGKG